jgi:hypothetical protein
MSRFYEVRFTVRLPVEATREEAEQWLRFHMRDGCELPLTNPLSDHEPEPVRGTFRTLPTAGTAGVRNG